METQQQLQRQAAGLGLQRQLQLDDAATKRQQELDDAATTRAQQVSDATLAHERGLDRITKQLTEADRLEDENKAEERRRLLKENREEISSSVLRLRDGHGVELGITLEEIKKASPGELRSFARDINMELEIIKLNKKDRNTNLDKLTSLAKKKENAEIFKEILGLGDDDISVIDTSGFNELTNATISDMLAEANNKIKARKFPHLVPEYKQLKRLQNKLIKSTGLYDALRQGVAASAAQRTDSKAQGQWIAKDPAFLMQLAAAEIDEDDQRVVISRLMDGDLAGAAQFLDNAGDMGNTPLVDAFTRWQDSSKGAAMMGVQGAMMQQQGAGSRLREINEQLRGMVQRHPWLEETVDLSDIYSSEELKKEIDDYNGAGTGAGAGAGTGAGTGLGEVGAAESDLIVPTEAPALTSEVDVEGGLPPEEKLKAAQEILGEGYGEGIFPSVFGGGGRGWFKPTLTPDRMVQEAQEKITNRKRMIELQLNEFGAARDPSTKKVKVSQTNEGTVDRLKKWYEASDGQAGLGSGLSDVEPTIPAVRPLTLDEIRKRGVEAEELFKELDKISEQLKTLQLNAPRQTGLKP